MILQPKNFIQFFVSLRIDENDESSKNDLENNLSSAVMDNTLFASGIEDKR